MDGLKLKTIFICREKDPNSHNAYITIEALITQLEKPPSDSTAKDVSNVGFGKKRFYEQLLNMGFVFDNRLLFEAQSPDIDYSDCETEADGFAYYNGLPKEYEALKRSHDKLEQQLADEKAKDRFGMGTPKIEQGEPKDSEQIISELKDQITQLTNDNASLKNQLAQANAALANKPADSITQSNTDIYNIKKEAIKQFNRSLATVLIDLDYKGRLRKGDIANYIVPYMKELAFVLADEQQDKANNLTVTYDTLYDNHLKNLGFKQGRQSDDEKQKVNIDLLFKKQLPITE